jgi:hypothetical protein
MNWRSRRWIVIAVVFGAVLAEADKLWRDAGGMMERVQSTE